MVAEVEMGGTDGRGEVEGAWHGPGVPSAGVLSIAANSSASRISSIAPSPAARASSALFSTFRTFETLPLSQQHREPRILSTTMPTPESAAFLAKKPTVPPTFDGVDYDDNKALKAAQDSILREQWVKSMMARLVREEMGRCYYREGVNHLEKCGHLRGKSALLIVHDMISRRYGF